MAIALPVIKDLCEALETTDDIFELSDEILNMFGSQNDGGTAEQIKAKKYERFNIGRKLYQGIMNNDASFAVFYRIEERETLNAQYSRTRIALRDLFKNHCIGLGVAPAPDLTAVDLFLTNRRGALDPVRDKIEIDVINHILQSPDRALLQTKHLGTIDAWFEHKASDIKHLAETRFYNIANTSEAYKVGTIYGPGSDHNWGVNVAWALGVARHNVPVRILSPLN